MSIIASLAASSLNPALQFSDGGSGNSPLVIALNQLIGGAAYTGAMQEWYPQYVIGVANPTALAVTPSATGGTLAANTYYWVVTALNGAGQTMASNEVSATTTGSTSSATLSWSAMAGAASYRVWRGTTAGSEGTYYSTANTTFTDTGASGSSSTLPVSNTTGTTYTPTLTQTPLNVLLIANKSTANNVTVNWTSNGTAVNACVLGPNSLILLFGTQAIGTASGITAFTLTASAQGTPVAWAGVP